MSEWSRTDSGRSGPHKSRYTPPQADAAFIRVLVTCRSRVQQKQSAKGRHTLDGLTDDGIAADKGLTAGAVKGDYDCPGGVGRNRRVKQVQDWISDRACFEE